MRTHTTCALAALVALVATCWLAGATQANAATNTRLRHLPPAKATPDAPLELEATVNRTWQASIEVRYRIVGGTWQSAGFRRERATTYVAAIPAESIHPPGLEYYIVSRGPGGEQARFGSADAPHHVAVFRRKRDVRVQRELARFKNRRAQVRVRGEMVDFGSRDLGPDGMQISVPDTYLRIEADFTYRVLRFPLHSLRFGYTRLVGRVPESERGDDGSCDNASDAAMCTFDAGFKVGGWFELGLQLAEGVSFDARGMVMATSEGFNVGGRGEFRLGYQESSHVALGAEVVADTGATGFFRLGWGTVPSFPMSATVEVTNLPAEHRSTGVRLLYDVYHPLDEKFTVGVRVGYQARDQLIGGISGGLTMAYDF